jgi:hypothetical protein
MGKTRIAITVIALTLLVPRDSQGNDASYQGFGATVYLSRDARIAMVSEEVDIRHVGAGDRTHGRRVYLAEATFRFRNLTDREVTVLMGHPDWREHGDLVPAGERPWALAGFRVLVDGVPVEPSHQEASQPPAETDPGGDEATRQFWHGAWTWEVTFPPGGERVVRNTYRFGGLQTNGPYTACTGDRPSRDASLAFWRRVGDVRGGWEFDNGACSTVTYIATSGRTWSGPIGEAVISMDVNPSVPPHLFVPEPRASEVRDGRVIWRFRDWIPATELSVHTAGAIPGERASGLPAFDNPSQARAWVSFAKANGFDCATVKRVRAWTAAAREGRFDDPVLGDSARAAEVMDDSFVKSRRGWDRQTRRILAVLDRFVGTMGCVPGADGRTTTPSSASRP